MVASVFWWCFWGGGFHIWVVFLGWWFVCFGAVSGVVAFLSSEAVFSSHLQQPSKLSGVNGSWCKSFWCKKGFWCK